MAKPLAVFFGFDSQASLEPWVTDGTVAGTALLKNIGLGSGTSKPAGYVSLGDNRIVFQATSPNAATGRPTPGLWITDGTAAGTVLVKELIGPRDYTETFFPISGYDYVSLGNGRAVLQVRTTLDNAATPVADDIWVTDGTAAGTVVIKHLDAVGGQLMFQKSLAPIGNGRAVFRIPDATNKLQLWATDGTAAGTVLLRDASAGEITGSRGFATLGSGRAVFSLTQGARDTLWVTNGTAAGTTQLKDVVIQEATSAVGLGNGRAVFLATTANGATANGIWVTDGTAVGTVQIRAAGGSDFGGSLTAIGNGRAVFRQQSAATGAELWVTDGTAAGTGLVTDLFPGTRSSDPGSIIALGNGLVLFSANDGLSGYEPWVSDGTAAGTRQLKNIAPLSNGSFPNTITALGGGQALFTTLNGELWLTDGTTAGTGLVTTLATGALGSFPYPVSFTALTTDPVPYAYSITATDASKPDGTAGLTPYIFTATRTGDLSAPATLGFTVTATGPNSLPLSLIATRSGTIGFVAGASTATVTVNVQGAGVASAQTFTVSIDGAPARGATSATGTVLGNLGVQATLTGTVPGGVFTDTPGTQLYVGANGQTTLRFTEGLRGGTFLLLPNGDVRVTHGRDTDIIRGLTELRFIDGRLVFDAGDPAAAVTRVYQAALGRLPDQGGLNFWIASLQSGTPLAALATGFLGSAEFIARFGAGLSNLEFREPHLPERAGARGRRGAGFAFLDRGAERHVHPAARCWPASPTARRTAASPPTCWPPESGT